MYMLGIFASWTSLLLVKYTRTYFFQDVLRQDLSEYDGSAIFISSYGFKGEIRTTNGRTITVKKIVSAFEEATLQDIPKLFFITNCLDQEIILHDHARPDVQIYVPMTYHVMIVYGMQSRWIRIPKASRGRIACCYTIESSITKSRIWWKEFNENSFYRFQKEVLTLRRVTDVN